MLLICPDGLGRPPPRKGRALWFEQAMRSKIRSEPSGPSARSVERFGRTQMDRRAATAADPLRDVEPTRLGRRIHDLHRSGDLGWMIGWPRVESRGGYAWPFHWLHAATRACSVVSEVAWRIWIWNRPLSRHGVYSTFRFFHVKLMRAPKVLLLRVETSRSPPSVKFDHRRHTNFLVICAQHFLDIIEYFEKRAGSFLLRKLMESVGPGYQSSPASHMFTIGRY